MPQRRPRPSVGPVAALVNKVKNDRTIALTRQWKAANRLQRDRDGEAWISHPLIGRSVRRALSYCAPRRGALPGKARTAGELRESTRRALAQSSRAPVSSPHCHQSFL